MYQITTTLHLSEIINTLFSEWNFWLLAIPYGVSISINAGWSTMFALILFPFDIDQKEAGLIGAICLVVSALSSIICGLYDLRFVICYKIFCFATLEIYERT